MTMLLMIIFEVCTPTGCGHEQFFAEIPAAACLADKAGFEAGRDDARFLTIAEGPDAGKRWPVVHVECLPPDAPADVCYVEDGLEPNVTAAYPQKD